jgi:hypothetical protein
MITKTQATTQMLAEEQNEYAMWEMRIDGALSKHDRRTVVDYTGSARVRERLMAAYRGAGWTVDYGDSQRDGAYLSFS